MTYDIIIPHYGRGKLTDLCRACLRSVAEHSRDYRLIFVDNGSPEFDTIEPDLQQMPHLLIRNETNLGFVKAINQGLRASVAPYVVLLNNDAEAVPRWLHKLRTPLRGKVALSGPRTTAKGSWQGNWKLREPVKKPFLLPPSAMLAFFCVMLRRKVIKTVGLLDEDFGVGFGDDDNYCSRAKKAGFRLVLVQDLVIPHAHRSTFRGLYSTREIKSMQTAALKLYHEKRNA